MGHSIQNVDISKPLTHTMPYTLSTICTVQWQPWFIREENTSPKFQTPSNVSICPVKSVTTTKCTQVETTIRTMSMQMRFPETVSVLFVQKLFGYANRLLQQPSGWLVSDNLGGEDAGCGGPGLVWLHVVCGCEAGWMYCQNSLKRLWRQLMAEKWTFNSRATALLDIPAVSTVNCTLPQNLQHLWHCAVVHILEWPAQGTSVHYHAV